VNAPLKYALSAVGVVALATLALWPWLDADGRRGVVTAAAISLTVQVMAFALLLRYRDTLTGFLAVWVGGTLLRMLVVGGVALLAVRGATAGAVPMLLSLAAFFFGLLLLEPFYFGAEESETTRV
jgi:hypothetical protein